MNSEKGEMYDIWSDKLPIPILALSIVIFTLHKGELCILTTKRIEKNESGYALPVGIVKKGLSLEENFDFILKEKTGVSGVYKEQLYTFGDDVHQDPNGHVIAVSYFALVKIEDLLPGIDFTKVNIVSIKKYNELKLFYKHDEVISLAFRKLKKRLGYTSIVRHFLPEKFRITQMQEIYESILGKKIDNRNFRKKIFILRIIKEIDGKDISTNRPAKLYIFSDQKQNMIESL